MKKQLATALAATLLLGAGAGVASADPHWNGHDNGRHNGYDNSYNNGHDNGRHNGWSKQDDRRGYDYNNHWRSEWRRGHRMDYGYWSRAERVDWRRHHLRAPPRGYEWRQVDGNYVLAAVATGLIADLILNHSY